MPWMKDQNEMKRKVVVPEFLGSYETREQEAKIKRKKAKLSKTVETMNLLMGVTSQE